MTIVRVLPTILPVASGLLVVVIGLLALSGRLPRNRFGGIRTSATLRSDEAFQLGNRVAGLPVLVAGLVAVLGGLAALIMPSTVGAIVAGLIGIAGMVAIAGAGGVLGHRAAMTVPDPKPEPPAGCAGCACGNCSISQLAKSGN